MTPDAFAALMAPLGPWPARRHVAVAVSGGADSLCLAYLLSRWGWPLALVVDHGLRAESAAEAALTAHRLDELGIDHQVITLRGIGPGAARARAARYAALTQAARQAGLVDILLGHHAQDQAETVFMRGQAGSGAAGLAGMAAVVHFSDVRLVRPLLPVPPAVLRGILRAAGLAWVEDPSNASPAYTRNRVRKLVAAPPMAAALTAQARQQGAARALADCDVAAQLARRVRIYPEGYAVLSPGPLSAASLGAVIRTISGRGHAPPRAALARIAANPVPCVIGGVRLMAAGRLGPGLLIVREEAAVGAPVCGPEWDRFVLQACAPWGGDSGAPARGDRLGALGKDAAAVRGASPLPAAVLRVLPALRHKGKLAAVPHIGYPARGAPEGLVASFIPAHPLAGAPYARSGGCEAGGKPPC